MLSVVAHTYNTSTFEAEAGNCLELEPTLGYIVNSLQPVLHRETVSPKNKTKQIRQNNCLSS